LGLQPKGYHLVVARFEPENHVLEIVEGYHRSTAQLPLVIVGSAPYADQYTAQIKNVADADDRIQLLGGVWDQQQLDELYANALCYLHGHSVGGTNPSLLRAMGAGAAVVAYDVDFNREVLGDGRFFGTPSELAAQVQDLEQDSEGTIDRGSHYRERARRLYRWDDVASKYEDLLSRLAAGHSTRGRFSGRRREIELVPR
jgi:glycosyltransferase involved in cell wall biosynthesis